MKEKYLLLFSITPVQTFISQSRKTKDLFSGSQILSELCKTAIDFIMNNGGNIKFPDINNKHIPNRFISEITWEENDIYKLGKDLEYHVKENINKIGQTALKNAGISEPLGFYNQINDYFSIRWVFVPYKEDNYAEVYNFGEKIFGGIKNIKNYKQLIEIGKKCSVCGERNVIFYAEENKKRFELKPNYKYINNNNIKELINNYSNGLTPISEINNKNYIDENEGLCSVCFMKRFYNTSQFSSTSYIALMDSIYAITNDKTGLEKFNNFKSYFGQKFDEQLLFEENLSDKQLKEIIPDKDLDTYKKIRELDLEIKKIAEEKGANFKKYYAIIIFDGDNMGEWLSGSKIKNKENLEKYHSILTKNLGKFANMAKEILKYPKGEVVYAGGEDFLGFINLTYLIDVLENLRDSFIEIINEGLSDFLINCNEKITFSAGIVIAHYKIPLSEVISWARKMEQEAKDVDNKNAFAISVLKHSGNNKKAVFKFQYFSLIKDLFNYLNTGKKYNDGIKYDFSCTFIKKLYDELLPLIDENGKINRFKDIEQNMLNTEVSRLISRSCCIDKEFNETKEEYLKRKNDVINNFSKNVMGIYNVNNSCKNFDVNNFINILEILYFVTRKVRE